MALKNHVVGFYGSATTGHPDTAMAGRVGALLAANEAIVLCGGGSGLMEAAAKGALNRGGRVICVMPGSKGPKYEGDWPPANLIWVATQMTDGRNYLNAAAPHAAIAMDGGPGTLSEIALALKRKRLVVCLKSWGFLNSPELTNSGLLNFASLEAAAISALDAGMSDGYIAAQVAAMKTVQIPDQAANLDALRTQIRIWGGDPAF